MTYRDINFLEIGTSDFDTLIENATDSTTGISVEPIKYYLDRLPNKPNVIKVNAAIKAKNRDDTCQVYYVPEKDIVENNLPSFLKGCNSINGFHLQHNNGIRNFVVKEDIRQVSINDLLTEYNIRKIEFLKIDTEGGDCYVSEDLFTHLSDKEKDFYPDKILFESNELSDSDMVRDCISKFVSIGYRVESGGTDTVLVLN